jgi:hypothetical protein
MTDRQLDSQQTMTNALQNTITKKLKKHDPTRNPAPPSQRTNDQIRKNNARTTPPQKRLKRPKKLQKNDQAKKVRLALAPSGDYHLPYKYVDFTLELTLDGVSALRTILFRN